MCFFWLDLGCVGWSGRSGYVGRLFIVFVYVVQNPSNLPGLTTRPVLGTADKILNVFVGIHLAIRTLSSHSVNVLQGLALLFLTKDPTTITANTSAALVVSKATFVAEIDKRLSFIIEDLASREGPVECLAHAAIRGFLTGLTRAFDSRRTAR